MNEKIRILFVDDEVQILHSFRRMARKMREEWEPEFAESGELALEALGKVSFDVVVSDMRMPGMDGAELLSEVKKRHPNTIRIILSGQAGESSILRASNSMHQYLSKPCEFEELKDLVARSLSSKRLIFSPDLEKLMTTIGSLPSLPVIYNELMETMEKPEFSLQDVGNLISKDIAMTTKILQIVNSAYFGFPHKIVSAVHAVQILGINTIQGLVLSYHVFSKYKERENTLFPISALWDHCMSVGAYALGIAKIEKVERDLESAAFTTGVMHDLGCLILAENFPDQYQEAILLMKKRGIEVWKAEEEVFNANHATVGAYLLGLWGIPDSIVEAVGYHHNPSLFPSKTLTPLGILHVADVLSQDPHPYKIDLTPRQFDEDYLRELDLLDRIPVWQEFCRNKVK